MFFEYIELELHLEKELFHPLIVVIRPFDFPIDDIDELVNVDILEPGMGVQVFIEQNYDESIVTFIIENLDVPLMFETINME